MKINVSAQNFCVVYKVKRTRGLQSAIQNINNIEEVKPFFFNFDYDEGGTIRIGNGSENDHLHICKA
ncbi:hypothetical protein BpHYR1_027097 [Brachionus plicatilis]|uniref:Uncharacterized protein n=1 Tax=Brachionus plicatilis TaxID=10195 RepID=A0A3M7SLU9_BRAPC|nr:hypothetical protein BpHYR1_027097 [Brachionus plicatilis]